MYCSPEFLCVSCGVVDFVDPECFLVFRNVVCNLFVELFEVWIFGVLFSHVVSLLNGLSNVFWEDGCFDLLDSFGYEFVVSFLNDLGDSIVCCVYICWVFLIWMKVGQGVFYMFCEFWPVCFSVVGKCLLDVFGFCL